MSPEGFSKLYYSIGEVSRITGLPSSVLRFWETEFDGVRPAKNRAGKRIYRQIEIERILRIKKLLYEDRYTIEGARKALRDDGDSREKERKQAVSEHPKIGIHAEEIRRGLKEILTLLSS